MEHLQPIDLLKNTLFQYEKALYKSTIAFKNGSIDSIKHETHKVNLEPLIFKYKQVIELLNNMMP